MLPIAATISASEWLACSTRVVDDRHHFARSRGVLGVLLGHFEDVCSAEAEVSSRNAACCEVPCASVLLAADTCAATSAPCVDASLSSSMVCRKAAVIFRIITRTAPIDQAQQSCRRACPENPQTVRDRGSSLHGSFGETVDHGVDQVGRRAILSFDTGIRSRLLGAAGLHKLRERHIVFTLHLRMRCDELIQNFSRASGSTIPARNSTASARTFSASLWNASA